MQLQELDIAVDSPHGNKLMTFRVTGSSGVPDLPPVGLDGRLLGPGGVTLTGAFHISSVATPQQRSARIAFNGSVFLVAWEENGVIRARRFSSSASPLGADFNLSIGPGASLPRLATNPVSGDFLVVWQQSGVLGQIVHGDGTLGLQASLNVTTSGTLGAPAVATNPSGAWMVVWTGPDVLGTGIVAREFSASLVPAGGETPVNQQVTGNLQEPAVTWVPAAGKWLFVWTGLDSNGYGVKGRFMP
jgi:hypothetical protein